MPIGPQPRGARGTVGHPYSALNLRLALAIIGLLFTGALATVLLWRGLIVLGVLAGVLAAIAVADLVVIQHRRRQRRRSDPIQHHMFE